jgi:hypothetical protein
VRRIALVLALLVVGCGDDHQGPATTAPTSAVSRPTPATPRLTLHKVATVSQPVLVTQPPGDDRRLFVVQKGGSVRVIRGGRLLRRPFLSIRKKVSRGTE